MRNSFRLSAALLAVSLSLSAKVVVFWQEGFPAVESEAPPRDALEHALGSMQPVFAGVGDLARPETLRGADLLVLPYGSAFPTEAWSQIQQYIRSGGHLLNLGGRPFFVPVGRDLTPGPVQNTYARTLGIRHSYQAPRTDFSSFAWEDDHSFLAKTEVQARRAFVLIGGGRGLGFLLDSKGERVAAAATSRDSGGGGRGGRSAPGARQVYASFDPMPGYWASPAGVAFIRETAQYAALNSTMLWLEVQNPTVAEGETPQVVVHLRSPRQSGSAEPQKGVVRVELLSGNQVLDTKRLDYAGGSMAANVVFAKALPPGLYVLRGIYEEDGKTLEVYRTGFWSRDAKLLAGGDRIGVNRDYFTKRGAPFVPFGVNYFSGDRYTNGFWVGGNLAGNAHAWDRDFAEMERSHIVFVRTGVWLNHADYLDRVTGGASERFLRAVEAYLHSAARHHIQVNFTFFGFDPQTIRPMSGRMPPTLGPGSNPYTDPVAIQAQKEYVSSIASRFKDVPFLSWDLINEPTFSNPEKHFSGNVPNGDPTETAAWRRWLEQRYKTNAGLADAWGVTPEEVPAFGNIPLPDAADLSARRGGSSRALRAVDYNLFAQDMFNHWASEMIAAIRAAGSKGLVTVGQDEGGVTNRVLNQFYGSSGVNFTVNHTWWQDDALLWDSVVAKRPDMPNLIGETGVQPVGRMDDGARQDEINAFTLNERKLALGFAAANTGGALHWQWQSGDQEGQNRSDGSRKAMSDLLLHLGAFAEKARPFLTRAEPPEVAIVLPQSLQMSPFNRLGLEVQQKSVRALYHNARAAAYAVGEYQLDLLGNPRLMILPAPWVLSQQAWEKLLAKVREGAVLLVSGRIDLDEHFQPRERARDLGIGYEPGVLLTRENPVEWAGQRAWFTYAGDKTTLLDRGFLPSDQTYAEKTLGKGKILYFPLPLEMSEDLANIGSVYRFAMKQAGVRPVYTTETDDPGMLICPTRLESGTLYVLTSESSSRRPLAFHDVASGRDFQVKLPPGRAALLLVTDKGEVAASYNWESIPVTVGGRL